MILSFDEMKKLFSDEGLELAEEQYSQFYRYAELLVEWNEKMNLTGITDPKGITIKHFLDSAMLLKFCGLKSGASVIDVGTGAGFPGIPLKILRPDIKLTLLDSLNKRILFLKEVCAGIGIEADCIHARAEDGARKPELREKFDLATARAVASMPVLSEYCLPFVKKGGSFAALKGPNENIKEAEKAISILSGKISGVEEYSIPGGDKRMLIIVKKISQSSSKYPRNSGQISKNPL